MKRRLLTLCSRPALSSAMVEDDLRLRPKRIVGDKGYCGRSNRNLLRRRGIRFTIAKRSGMCRTGPIDPTIYRQRNAIERLINRFKHFRCLATRYEKLAANYRLM